MTLEQRIKLLDAGYTKEEIAELDAGGPPAADVTPSPAPEAQPAAASEQPAAAPRTPPADDPTDAPAPDIHTIIKQSFDELSAKLFSQPSIDIKPVGLEDIFKNYFKED